MLVEGRAPVLGQDVVQVAAALRDGGLAAVFPALTEKFLHILVGDVLVRLLSI